MFTFRSESPNGINGTAKYMVDIHLVQKVEVTDDIGCMLKRYTVYKSIELEPLSDDEYVCDDGVVVFSAGGTSRRLIGNIEPYYGRLDGRLPAEWTYRVDTPYGNVREYPAFGPPARRNQAASRVFDEGDWNEAVDWCVGWDNRTNDTYDLAVRHFSTGGDLMMVGIIPLFNEQFIDLGA